VNVTAGVLRDDREGVDPDHPLVLGLLHRLMGPAGAVLAVIHGQDEGLLGLGLRPDEAGQPEDRGGNRRSDP